LDDLDAALDNLSQAPGIARLCREAGDFVVGTGGARERGINLGKLLFQDVFLARKVVDLILDRVRIFIEVLRIEIFEPCEHFWDACVLHLEGETAAAIVGI
jgi:hypothetical protein